MRFGLKNGVKVKTIIKRFPGKSGIIGYQIQLMRTDSDVPGLITTAHSRRIFGAIYWAVKLHIAIRIYYPEVL